MTAFLAAATMWTFLAGLAAKLTARQSPLTFDDLREQGIAGGCGRPQRGQSAPLQRARALQFSHALPNPHRALAASGKPTRQKMSRPAVPASEGSRSGAQ